jgi:hypothetical protein
MTGAAPAATAAGGSAAGTLAEVPGATFGSLLAGFTSGTWQLGQTVRPSYHFQHLTQTSWSDISLA